MSTISENKNVMELSLSEIFDYADKNLKQARWICGDAKHNLSCAVGAVSYVLSNGKTTIPVRLKKIDPKLKERYKFLCKEFIKRDKYHIPLAFYNDWLFYSFKRLAEKCRSLGL